MRRKAQSYLVETIWNQEDTTCFDLKPPGKKKCFNHLKCEKKAEEAVGVKNALAEEERS